MMQEANFNEASYKHQAIGNIISGVVGGYTQMQAIDYYWDTYGMYNQDDFDNAKKTLGGK